MNFYRVARRLSDWGVPLLPRLIDYLSRVCFACWVPHKARIGSGVVLGYGGLGIVVHDDAVIGDNAHIDQGVTIGGSARSAGAPCIENDVYIGAGAKILGPIRVGSGSVIGANAVVVRDVKSRSVVVGIPATAIRHDIDIDDYLYHRRTVGQRTHAPGSE